MANKQFNSLQEFYPYYLTEHLDPTCRKLHLIGTGLVVCLFSVGIATLSWQYFALMPVAGYGFAWAGHFFFEKNRPAAFSNPFYSLASDFLMFWHSISRRLPEELEAARKSFPKTE